MAEYYLAYIFWVAVVLLQAIIHFRIIPKQRQRRKSLVAETITRRSSSQSAPDLTQSVSMNDTFDHDDDDYYDNQSDDDDDESPTDKHDMERLDLRGFKHLLHQTGSDMVVVRVSSWWEGTRDQTLWQKVVAMDFAVCSHTHSYIVHSIIHS